MTYQTLYRKYRPKSFKDIVGQKNIVRVLSNAVIHNKIAHAYLFCGPRGTGKTSMAKIFAKVINCQNLNGVEPCGCCECCKQIEDKNFLDIIEIDAASNNGVDEIREIKNKANLSPNLGKYKVYIIDEVHMLSIGAFNALLKTLEEPPAHIIFILATTEVHKLPITVISRCQRFDFKRFLDSEIFENLSKICKLENFNFSDEILNEIAILSDGGMRDAIGLLDQLSLYQSDSVSIEDLYQLTGNLSTAKELEFLENYFDGNINLCLDNLCIFETNGKNFSKINSDFIKILENVIKYKMIPNYYNENDINFFEKYKYLADKVDTDYLFRLINSFLDVDKTIKNTYNPRILIEMSLLINSIPSDYKSAKINSNNIDSNSSINVDSIVDSKISENNMINNSKIDDEKIINVTSIYSDFSLSTNQIDVLKSIRVNNALFGANKPILNELKNMYSLIMDYMFDDNYGSLVCNLQGSELRVASMDYVIISLEYSSTVDIINEKIYLLDELLSKVFGKKYKSIVVSDSDWSSIKKSYVDSIKNNITYNLMEEPDYFEDDKKNNVNSDLEGIFGSDVNGIIEVR